MIPLDMLQAGETGRIVDIRGEQGLVHRLAEIGLRKGVALRMVRPGKPCIMAVEHQRISFRSERTAAILVEVF